MSVRTITVLEDALRKELALLIEQRDSLAAEIAGLRAQVMHEGERLERAEQERDDAISRMEARIVGLIGDRNRAEARAQKAEAALREIVASGYDCGEADCLDTECQTTRFARFALSEEPRENTCTHEVPIGGTSYCYVCQAPNFAALRDLSEEQE